MRLRTPWERDQSFGTSVHVDRVSLKNALAMLTKDVTCAYWVHKADVTKRNLVMANGRFVAYDRVSPRKQGRSGVGLKAQQTAEATHLNGRRWKLVGKFQETESGKRSIGPRALSP